MSQHILLVLGAALLVASCTPEADETVEEPIAEAETALEEPAVEEPAVEETEEPDSDLPQEFLRTAWRVTGEDGARYTTYLDDDGTYRDLRNGDLWQEGTWDRGSDGKLCLTPDDENGVTMCWEPVRMDGESAMIAESDAERRVTLERVDYRAPVDEENGNS